MAAAELCERGRQKGRKGASEGGQAPPPGREPAGSGLPLGSFAVFDNELGEMPGCSPEQARVGDRVGVARRD